MRLGFTSGYAFTDNEARLDVLRRVHALLFEDDDGVTPEAGGDRVRR